MSHAYSEAQMVEQPAIGLFAEQSALLNPRPGLSVTLLPIRLLLGEARVRVQRIGEGTGIEERSLASKIVAAPTASGGATVIRL